LPTVTGAGANSKTATSGSLTDARKELKTKLIRPIRGGQPANQPPPSLARLIQYDTSNGKLAAYITTIPPGGQRSPAIIWISGGDCNTIDDGFFQDSPPSNDQTASAFRKAGIVTMYVSLRGGNDNPGFKEGFLGEVDDVLAAAEYLSKMDGIDPSRIYLGGHSTGGTLALLVAESTNNFRAIFSFGPVDDIRGYGHDYIYFDSRIPAEIEARTPSRWLHAINNRTFVLEGLNQGNVQALLALKHASRNPQVSFHSVAGANHFNILAPVTQKIAEKILQDQGSTTNITITDADLNLKYSQ
jgi:dipeptidyl aminopeptidase/acylaminoacyl peptidase